MSRTQCIYIGAINDLTIYTHPTRPQQISCHRRVLHKTRLVKDSCNRHILCSCQLNLWQIIRQLTIFHSIAGTAMQMA